jgi:hypothetical protein
MSNPQKYKVVFDEDLSSVSEEEAKDMVSVHIDKLDGIESVEFGRVIDSIPVDVIVEVGFDGTNWSSEELEYELSTLDFVHNALSV